MTLERIDGGVISVDGEMLTMSSATASWCRPIRAICAGCAAKIGMVFQPLQPVPGT